MPQNKLSFESENLVVDYITFKFQYLDNRHQTRIAKYLFQLGFNSYQKNREENKSRKELNIDLKNKFELTFILYTRYYDGIQLHFTGLSMNQFYSLIKRKRIKWKNLTEFNPILYHFDVCYDRLNQSTNKIDSIEFINICF